MHYTTFVLLPQLSGLVYRVPFLVLGGSTSQEVEELPLVTSMHRIDNTLGLSASTPPPPPTP